MNWHRLTDKINKKTEELPADRVQHNLRAVRDSGPMKSNPTSCWVLLERQTAEGETRRIGCRKWPEQKGKTGREREKRSQILASSRFNSANTSDLGSGPSSNLVMPPENIVVGMHPLPLVPHVDAT